MIVSGGQTGADQAGLDAAINLGIPYGGWIPKGRLTEDGPLPEKYQLQEMLGCYPSTTNLFKRIVAYYAVAWGKEKREWWCFHRHLYLSP